eukprot:TRINITY_DN80786_c0_g1_i1.p1 TRINITY_DN80786_c0_g1~~TRINITY_DN80786_c0_g1_i1.p1  ORF type:complete len:453 (+),score=101.12 TRINITY_DN80786_c0_g1_i1:1-1359(+)
MITSQMSYPLGLKALLFCVFDKDEGPMVRCSDPPNAVGRLLKPLGRYLLPETFIKGRVVSMVLDDNVIVGAPVYIEDNLYDRNIFQFNICMVVSSSLDPEPHRDIAQHLAMAFHSLEVEIKMLSSPSDEVGSVEEILQQIRYQLNTTEECFVRVGKSHAISFKVRRWNPVLKKSPSMSAVPVPLVDLQHLLKPSDIYEAGLLPSLELKLASEPSLEDEALPLGLDPVLKPVLPLVDGVRTVQQIADASQVGHDNVVLILRHLLHFGFVSMIDEIRLDCRYRLTPEFHQVIENPAIRTDVLRYVRGGHCDSSRPEDAEEEVHAVIALYAQIDGREQTLQEFREAHAEELRERAISLRHFVTFGLLKGFLERIDNVGGTLGTLEQKEIAELQHLRHNVIPKRKQELEQQGLKKNEVNQDKGIKEMVQRMKDLQAKEIGYTSEDPGIHSAAESKT